MSWLGRAWARLLPPGRRDWAEALWAETQDVPPGWRRLAWRAGGVRMIAREARLGRRAGVPLLFAAAAGAAAWAAWPRSAVSLSHGGANDGDIIATLALLAVLPLLGRHLGPPGSRAAWWLRAGVYAAFLVMMPAKAIAELFVGSVPRGGIDLHTYDFITQSSPAPGSASGGPDWGGEIFILLITAGYLAAVTALTARRAGLAPATLGIGALAGLVLGPLLLCAVDSLGGGKSIIGLWPRGSAADPSVILAVVLLLSASASAVAGALAARCRRAPGDLGTASGDRTGQSVAAGLLAGAIGALTAALLDTGTTALTIKSALVRGWLYHGQHLTASAAYGRELYASQHLGSDAAFCVALPVIGLLMGAVGAGISNMADLLAGAGPGQA